MRERERERERDDREQRNITEKVGDAELKSGADIDGGGLSRDNFGCNRVHYR